MQKADFTRKPWDPLRTHSYDGAWPVAYGYDPEHVSKYVAERLAPYIIGFTRCPNFKFDGIVGSSRARRINTEDPDDAINQSILEFQKYPNRIVLYKFRRILYPDPNEFTPKHYYSVSYAKMNSREEELD